MDALTPRQRPAGGISDILNGLPDDPARRMRWYAIGGGALALILLVAAIVMAFLPSEADQKAGGGALTIPLVSVMRPGLSPVTARVQFTGTIAARYELPISVEGDGGRIAAVFVEAGDPVRTGQPLARLSTTVLEPQVTQLAAALEEARASAALAAADYSRALQVAATGALSREEIDRRKAAAATAAARAKVVAAQLSEARARLDRTLIRAPHAGLVLERTAEVGQSAMMGGAPLFRLAQGGEVEMRGQVAEQDMPALRVGQMAQVRLTGVEKPFIGRIRLLSPIIDARTRLGGVRIALDRDPQLRPGAFANATVEVGDARRPVLPQTAILVDASGPYVLTLGADDRVVRRKVTVSGASPAGVIIAGGLDGSEAVVTTAGAFLNEGERIKPSWPRTSRR